MKGRERSSFIYLYIYTSIYLYIYLSIHLSIYTFIYLYIYLSIYLFRRMKWKKDNKDKTDEVEGSEAHIEEDSIDTSQELSNN